MGTLRILFANSEKISRQNVQGPPIKTKCPVVKSRGCCILVCLTGHSHQKWPTNLCCMTERPSVFDFCFKASLCELLGDEYLISWLLSARMHVSGTAMHITISPLSHPVDGHNVTLKKLSSKNHTQAPRGLAPPNTCQTTAKTLWKIGLQNQTVRRVYM